LEEPHATRTVASAIEEADQTSFMGGAVYSRANGARGERDVDAMTLGEDAGANKRLKFSARLEP
jgi:hypothetical protein